MVLEQPPKEPAEQSLLNNATPFQLEDEGVDLLLQESKPHSFDTMIWFPVRIFPFSDGILTGVVGFVLQIIWLLLLLVVGLFLVLGSMCLGLMGLSVINSLVQGWYYGYGK